MAIRLALTGLLILVGVLSIANSLYALRYCFATREQQRMNGMIRMINNNRSVAQALALDAARYSEKNPAINPILIQYGVKTNAATPSPPKKP